tara:strand:- start:81 stop:635 length:555 start_codon:yes stop_codon:yes gene_type:complete
MALKPCRECNKKVSTEASVCPLCGVPNPTKKKTREEAEKDIINKYFGGRSASTTSKSSSSRRRKIYKKNNTIGIISYISDHWEGNLSLVKSFWLNGFLLNIIFALPLVYAEMSIDGISENVATLFLIYFLFYAAYFVWVNVGIWRSSGFYISNKQNNKLWGYASRVAVVLSVLRAVGEFIVGLN